MAGSGGSGSTPKKAASKQQSQASAGSGGAGGNDGAAALARLAPPELPEGVHSLLRQCTEFMQEQSSVGSEALVSARGGAGRVQLLSLTVATRSKAAFQIKLPTALPCNPAPRLPCLPAPALPACLLQVACLIELVQNGAAVAHHLWVLLFPIVWSSLQKDQQVRGQLCGE
jgi:hypothetical protein